MTPPPVTPAVSYPLNKLLTAIARQHTMKPALTDEDLAGHTLTKAERAALKAGGFDWENVVDTWVLLSDTRDYSGVAAAYREVFTKNFPASTVVGEQPLGRGLVQIQVMAVK